MNPTTNAAGLTVGRLFFAVSILFFGLQHFLYGKFVTRVMPPWPGSIPGANLWPYAVGLLLVIEGAGMAVTKSTRTASLALAVQTFLGAILLALPAAIAGARWGGEWTFAGKAFALAGGACAVAVTASPKGAVPLLFLARLGLGGFMILGGIQHFIWAKFVATLVPAWIPGSLYWVYFTGVALIAGGLGMLVPRTTRLAAGISAVMIFSWVVLLHLPRALADVRNANESTAVFEALAFSGTALLIALLSKRRG